MMIIMIMNSPIRRLLPFTNGLIMMAFVCSRTYKNGSKKDPLRFFLESSSGNIWVAMLVLSKNDFIYLVYHIQQLSAVSFSENPLTKNTFGRTTKTTF